MSQTDLEPPGPFDSPLVSPYLTGVYLAVNGISDVYLVVDGPNCVFFRIPQVQANHDWQADLARSSGLHRIVDTDATPNRASAGDTTFLTGRLRRVDELPDCAAILLTAMASVSITGRQYDALVGALEPPLEHPVIILPEGSLSGDWLDGYERTLEALARELPLDPRPEHSGSRPRVALVGHLHHRNEDDVLADEAELRRMVTGLGLELVSLWPDGGPLSGLQRAGGADIVLALPYARRAAARLAERLGTPLVEAPLPLGLEATGAMLRNLAAAAGRPEAAETFVAGELDRLVPRLKWVLAHEMLGKRVLVAGDPILAPALRGALVELGCEVPLEAVLKGPFGRAPKESPTEDKRILRIEATGRRALAKAAEDVRKNGNLDIAVISSEALETLWAGGPPIPFLEVGFPAYYSHAFSPMPILGYQGVACLVTRLLGEIRHAQLSRGLLDSP
ncbi:MAG: nitrogenase component 1 [Polyangia bacterium]|jgi:nitrogenase molybdenum-iron protein alpha/beta subunit|nr:nitrogenase component 1 [Polyangia bacterium]